MAYKQPSPIAVVEGGTGATSLTDHGVLVGSGAAAITALAVGTDGQVLVGSTGADPVFSTLTSSDNLLTLTGGAGTLDITSNQAVSSSAVLTDFAVVCGNGGSRGVQSIAGVGTSGQVLTSNGAGALPTFQAPAVDGPGSSTDNALARWSGTGGNTLQDSTVIVTDNGEMTNASQPAFLAYLGSTDSNASGDLTIYTLGATTALTEVYDQNGDFVTTGTFTAPVTGRYTLFAQFYITGGTGITGCDARIVTSNRTYVSSCDGLPGAAGRTAVIQQVFAMADMDASDTATFTVLTADTGGKIDDVIGSGSPFSYCYGVLQT